jgi:glycosyltransferase involved in cell wall biosynthesis
MSGMRVLFVVHGFPPAALGGTEIYAHDLARALVERHEDAVTVLARESDRRRPEYDVRRERRDGLDLVLLNNTYRSCHTFEETYRNRAIAERALQVVDEVRPDVVHVHHLSGLSSDLLAGIASRGIPIAFTLNDYWMICHRGQLFDLDRRRCDGPYPSGCARCIDAFTAAGGGRLRLAGAVRRFTMALPAIPGRGLLRRTVNSAIGRLADPGGPARATAARRDHLREAGRHVTRFLAPSRTLRERFLRFGIEEERLVLQEQGIDQSRFRGLRRTPSHRLRVGFAGSLIVSKAPHLLIEAFEGIPETKATLHVYGAPAPYHGDDRYEETLRPLLRRPYVHCPGAVPHERVPEALASLDVLVIPSVWIENAPFVIREAFAAGLPVIASRLGGMAEMVEHEKSGLLFEPGDAADLRRAILRLVEEPGLLERLRAGLPRVKTIEEDAAWTRVLYRSLVATRSDRTR